VQREGCTAEMTIVSTQGGRVLTVVAQHNRRMVAVKSHGVDCDMRIDSHNQLK
jgi:hypothetical protein